MAPPTQLFVRVLDGSTRCLHFERDKDVEYVDDDGFALVTLGDLRRRLEDLEGVPVDQQLIVCGSRVLGSGGHEGQKRENNDFANDSLVLGPADADGQLPSCTLLLKLAGGKGGFGALLRGAANSAGTTTNFDACRDLSGRRLRHVNGEKKIIEFAKHAHERELEATAQAYINRKDSQIKRKFDDIEEAEKARYKEETRAAIENVTDAVQGGLMQAKQLDEDARKKQAEESAREAVAMKRMNNMWGVGGNSDSDDSDSDLDEEDLVKAGLMPTIKRFRGGGGGSGSGSGSGSGAGAVLSYTGKGKEPEVPVVRPVTPPEEVEAAGAAAKANGVGKKGSKGKAIVAEEEAEKGEKEKKLPAKIVLKDYACPADLEVFGLDRLKEELMSKGLKCGGSLRERAERLFLLRDKTLAQIDKKHLAKK